MKHQQQKVAMPFSRLKGNLHFHVHICSTPAQGYHEYIDDNLPPESPYLYGLHPNAEIGFLTVTSERLFRTVLEMQPKESDAVGGSGASREEKVSENAAALVGVAGGGGGMDRAEQGTQLSVTAGPASMLAQQQAPQRVHTPAKEVLLERVRTGASCPGSSSHLVLAL